MCKQRENNNNKSGDSSAVEQYNALFQQLQDELNELLETTAHLQEESERLEREARKLIDENIQVQIEARLLREKYRQVGKKHRHRHRRQSIALSKKPLNFGQLKRQLQRQRQSFDRFERRLRAKYEQPFHQIVSNVPTQPHRRRVRSMPSESVD